MKGAGRDSYPCSEDEEIGAYLEAWWALKNDCSLPFLSPVLIPPHVLTQNHVLGGFLASSFGLWPLWLCCSRSILL